MLWVGTGSRRCRKHLSELKELGSRWGCRHKLVTPLPGAISWPFAYLSMSHERAQALSLSVSLEAPPHPQEHEHLEGRAFSVCILSVSHNLAYLRNECYLNDF